MLGSRRPFNAEETRELFEIINEQADRLRDLVDNILDMTRIEAGSMSVSPEPVDLREVLDEALTALTRAGGVRIYRSRWPMTFPWPKQTRAGSLRWWEIF